jgi:hypothetical protein
VRGQSRFWLPPAILIASGAVAVVMIWALRPTTQVSLSMRPVRPLTAAACVAEARHYGYSTGGAGTICPSGTAHSWYHALLTNNGPYALMSCAATGYDSRGKTVFHGPLLFGFGGVRGLFAPDHRSIAFSWYLPQAVTAPVTRYAATCSARPYP